MQTDAGDLKEIRRSFVQDGKVIPYPNITVNGNNYNSVTDGFCNDQKTAFGDTNDFEAKGGLRAMGQSMDRGHVLVMSLWSVLAFEPTPILLLFLFLTHQRKWPYCSHLNMQG